MTETETRYDTEDYVRRITGLLTKAEATDVPAEAEALVSKAQQMMLTHAITEELLRAAKAKSGAAQKPEEVVLMEVNFTGIYREALGDIARTVAKWNDCRCVISKKDWATPKAYVVAVIGHKSDVENVLTLTASILVQHATAKKQWEREAGLTYMSNMEKFKNRRQFTLGYAQGVGARLGDARRAARVEASQAAAKRDDVTVNVSSQSVELVLLGKKERVDKWIDEKYGSSLRAVRRNYAPGSRSADTAGYAAGTRADIGQARIGTQRALEG